MKKTTGKIRWFNTSKGFGVIEDINGESFFVHSSDIKNNLNENFPIDRDLSVQFEIDKSTTQNSLFRAKNVMRHDQ